ncbi:predicted protein [Arabidopsis lyrata subsp. lyrata]|uniref:Predicted protein n=1 Tax=Arabidopsis lyrata subsp. lyrata TaxID=81972 RepID=D7KNP5_ARALL|nr:predicted protein [Arabidopsis lyrata subsp. lyrata]
MAEVLSTLVPVKVLAEVVVSAEAVVPAAAVLETVVPVAVMFLPSSPEIIEKDLSFGETNAALELDGIQQLDKDERYGRQR